MAPDLAAARAFVATHARLLDRRRFDVASGGDDRAGILSAIEGYRNPDGGYGWGLESDLRSSESQPAAALHAFEAFAEAAPLTTPRAVELCDWLQMISLPDGGVPFTLPVSDPAGCAPWWLDADPDTSSLQITSIVAMHAHRIAEHDPAVADHDWLVGATNYCLETIAALNEEPHAYVLFFSVLFLDQIASKEPRAVGLLDGLGRYIPDDGRVRVQGGTEDEFLSPIEFAPDPKGAARGLYAEGVIDQDLQRLAGEQLQDGGWPWEPATFSPASALEWRGYTTVRAVSVLRQNGLLG